MRLKFEQQLINLNNEFIEMGALIESSINSTITSLINQDVELAQKVIVAEDIIDEKEKIIENLCLRLLLHQQPVAKDLRIVSSALKMVTDFERIGDICEDICQIVTCLSKNPYSKKLVDIPKMAEIATEMVAQSIDAFVKNDAVLAESVIQKDNLVDDLLNKVKSELVETIREDANEAQQALDFLMIAKYFEKIGDHAVNMAKWVVFIVSGEHN